MAANTNPIFTLSPSIQWGASLLTTANTARDGTGTVLTVFTSDATNGGFVQKVRVRAAGTNVATVMRLFINNGSTNATAANNILYEELTIAATTASEVAQLANNEITLNIALPAGYKLNATIGTTVATGLYVSTIGVSY